MTIHQCQICGTRTGQHGFSFDKQAQAMNAEKDKRAAGVLMIPAELVPKGQEALFMEQFHAALGKMMENRIDIPEVRIITDDGRS